MGGNHRVGSGLSRGPPLAICPQAPPPLSAGDPFPGARGTGGLFGRLCLLSSLRCDPGPTSALSLSESMLP